MNLIETIKAAVPPADAAERYGLTGHRGEEEYERAWKEKTDFYYDMLAGQQRELEAYGRLISY